MSRRLMKRILGVAVPLFLGLTLTGAMFGQVARIKFKSGQVQRLVHRALERGETPEEAIRLAGEVSRFMKSGDKVSAEACLDSALALLRRDRRASHTPRNIPDSYPFANPPYEALQVTGEPEGRNGIYDPSVEYDADGAVGWLTYSAVDSTRDFIRDLIGTHLARSTDQGKTWQFVKVLKPIEPAEITTEAGEKLSGNWRDEVPSLVFDPEDHGREWKLFTHHYFWNAEKDRMPQYGWISCQTASRPDGEWSAPVALFGSTRFPPDPYRPKIDLNALSPDLKNAITYSEPGALVFDNELYLSLSVIGGGGPQSIILLKSLDHGGTWQFVATLLDAKIAGAMGMRSFDGSSLVLENGTAYLMASPHGSKAMHEGTFLFEFDDISKGRLKMNGQGIPAVVKAIRPDESFLFSKIGAGQADYDERNIHGGIIFPQANMKDAPRIFQLWNTRCGIAGQPGEAQDGSEATAGESWKPGDYKLTMDHAGLTRKYQVHIPPGFDGSRRSAAVVILHGGGARADLVGMIRDGSGFDALADREGFITIYPEAIENYWNDGRELERYRSQKEKIDDVGFIKALLERLSKPLNLDASRIYAVGASNGAMMALRLACDASENFAAVGSVAGNLPVKLQQAARPSRPVSVIILNGTKDPLMPWNGGTVRFYFQKLGEVLSAKETRDYWIARNQCSGEPKHTDLQDKDPSDGTRVTVDSYGPGSENASVAFYTIDGGGHTWPGGGEMNPEKVVGRTTRDIDGTRIIWDFFKNSARP